MYEKWQEPYLYRLNKSAFLANFSKQILFLIYTQSIFNIIKYVMTLKIIISKEFTYLNFI